MLNMAFTNTHHCLPKQPTAHLDWIITCQSFFPLKAFVFRAVEGCYYPAWCERGRKLCKLSHYSRSWEWPAFNGSLHGRTASRTGDNSVRTSQKKRGKASDCAVKRARSVDWHTTTGLTIQPPLGSGLIKLPFRPQNGRIARALFQLPS